jgi:hypothetical protein
VCNLSVTTSRRRHARRFAASHTAKARYAPIPEVRELVEGVIDIGTVGLIAGLPFARKSWLALDIAHKIAASTGAVFGTFAVVTGGPVIYVWQDDSEAKELERIQLYAERHRYPDDLPLKFVLNEGVQLPDDLGELCRLIRNDDAVLLVIDSLYNTLSPRVGLKEESVAGVLAEVKREVADETSCTVALVDHAPWPTEGNRGQRRAYGSVFKTAAVRWSIHLEADPKDDTRLHVEASGNNVAGFRRTAAAWDKDALDIRLVDVERVNEEALDATVLAHVEAHPGQATSAIAAALEKSVNTIRPALQRLSEPSEAGMAQSVVCKTSRDLGTAGTGHYWFPHNHAAFEPSELFGPARDASPAQLREEGEPSEPSVPHRGDGSRDGSLTEDEIDRPRVVAPSVSDDFFVHERPAA